MSELNGQLQELGNSIRDLREKLQREEFSTAEKRYFDCVKDYEVHQAINEDLANFYNALEWALMKFHKERMDVINRMVREMWHSTYKGKDIDYIEIKQSLRVRAAEHGRSMEEEARDILRRV